MSRLGPQESDRDRWIKEAWANYDPIIRKATPEDYAKLGIEMPNKHSQELDVLTDHEKCKLVFRAICEGVDCALSYSELVALQDNGFITDLKRVHGNRWSFEWTDALRDYALQSPEGREKILNDLQSDSSP